MTSDTSRIGFTVRCKEQEYGDKAKFQEFTIEMRADGKVVGIESGPRRLFKTARDCLAAGEQRVREMQGHRLFIVDVSAADIDDGEARSCRSCAIAHALWRNQERIGLSEFEYRFRVEPYGAFVDCDGIVLEKRYGSEPGLVTGEKNMPDLVREGQYRLNVDSMYEWAMQWDEWADSRHMTDEEWVEDHPDDEGKPYKPEPCSFVLNLSEMKPAFEGVPT